MTIPHAAIDVHGHCVPRAFLDEILELDAGPVVAQRQDGGYVVRFDGSAPLRAISGVMLDGEDRGRWLDEQGVAVQFVAPWLDLYGQQLPPSQGARWVRHLNDHMASVAANSQGRLGAHAALHLGDASGATDELRRAVEQLGMTSTMIPASVPEGRLSDPAFDDLWTTASDLDVLVMLHATTGSAALALVDEYPRLAGLFGRNIEVALAAADLIVAGVLDRHPELRLLIVHGGGFLPYLTGRFDNDAKRQTWPCTLPSEAMRGLYYDTVLLAPAAIDCLCSVAGSSRIMLGSDFGSTPTERDGLGVAEAVVRSGLDAGAQARILRDNAVELFALG
jgi:aminocarboxymuconate-semialdehyde decarboxylase